MKIAVRIVPLRAIEVDYACQLAFADDEMARIKDRNMAGFLLLYRELVEFAREIMIEKGLANPEVPLEVQPPGTSRGSSVALLSGYLVGLSHIDPLKYELPLDRCLPDGGSDVTDIDLDFQPWLQKEILDRAADRWGWLTRYGAHRVESVRQTVRSERDEHLGHARSGHLRTVDRPPWHN